MAGGHYAFCERRIGGWAGTRAGGSGVVIFRYLTADATKQGLSITATGGSSSVSGDYTVWSFTSTGTVTVTVAAPSLVNAEYLVVQKLKTA